MRVIFVHHRSFVFKWAVVTMCTGLFACEKDKLSFNPSPLNVEIPEFALSELGGVASPQDNPLTVEGVALGRMLFYEKMLSDDQSISCASCHIQANSFNDSRAFSQGTNGAFGDRNAMSILNLAWNNQFFWDGRKQTLETQAHDPVIDPKEMRNSWPVVVKRLREHDKYPDEFFKAFGTREIDSLLVMKALAQFERTLVSFESPFDAFFYKGQLAMLNESQKRGFDLFFGEAECVHCHSGALLSDQQFRNNGLDANLTDLGRYIQTLHEQDKGKFKVPTLRNISLTAPYMHDGRFQTLAAVIEFYNSGVHVNSPNLDPEMHTFTNGLNLSAQQKLDLLHFLESFTDIKFTQNVNFSDPN